MNVTITSFGEIACGPRVVRGPGASASDDELVHAARGGDAIAFRHIYNRHAGYVARVTCRVLGGEADLDDVVQETFVDAHHGIGALENGNALRGWLVAIATRKARRVLGKHRRRAMLARLFGETLPRETDARLDAAARELRDALDRVHPDARVPWVLTRVCDLSLEEAAAACDVSLATVKRRIALADERIRRRLGHDEV